MKVLKEGRRQQGWAKIFECTGEGNKGGGCGALLLVEQRDLFKTSRSDYGGGIEFFATFKCNQCGVLTDIPDNVCPVTVALLPRQDQPNQ